MADERAYLLDNREPEAGRRFDAIAELFDTWTLQHLDRLGVADGQHCWEVGAGGPGIARALAQRVGPTGRVLASDLDTSWLTGLPGDTVEVIRHDITRDPLPDERFDLVHARLVLVHLPDRAEVLRKLASTVRPGGWLVIEDADPALQPLACPDEHGPNEVLANRIRRSFRARLAERGVDLAFGRTLPRLLRAAGLTSVAAESYAPVTSRACRELEAATVRQLRDQLVGPDLSAGDLDQHLANLRDTELDVTTAPLISCWGQRPTHSR
ncbi:methyltransferase domain-containing protein [Kitasatospora sp. RB6PN24]|uniref:methyltransferase domain-containing protein n=1 Tax=Kitasatospora humi TaxID=2893891 RepID=UPI001E46D756|nr:methyltransferase domain-containing protein [Kitasatospora humi]MCC9309556.1 methyltransferase domain-containing protein [Kitasatospora humi]